jgi:hypothetical protein
MKKSALLSACLIFFLTSWISVKAQETVKCNDTVFNDELMEELTGKWNATGTIRSESVNYFISGNWALNHQFLELYFKDLQKEPEYMARVFIGYDCLSERYVAHWLDNYGGRFSETLGYGVKNGKQIDFRFEYPDGPFINIFSYDESAERWTFKSKSKNKKGEWIVFGDLELTKSK